MHGIDVNRELIVSSHPAVLDGFIDMFRREVLEKEKEMSAAQEKEPDTSGHDVQKSEPGQLFEDMEDEDEIIDLGDEKDQVLAQMKKSLKGEQETELAFQIADRFIDRKSVV